MAAREKYTSKFSRLCWLGAAIALLICSIAGAQAQDFWTPARKNAIAEMLPRRVPGLLPDGAIIHDVALLNRTIDVTLQKADGQLLLITLLPRSTPRVLGQSVRFDISAPPGDAGGVLRAALVELVRQREGNFSWEPALATAANADRDKIEEKQPVKADKPVPAPATEPDPERQYWVLLPIAAVALAVWRATQKALT